MKLRCFFGFHSWNVILKADYEGEVSFPDGYLAFHNGTPKVVLGREFRVRVKPRLEDRYCPLCGILDLSLTPALVVWYRDQIERKTQRQISLDMVTKAQQTALEDAGMDSWAEVIRKRGLPQ